VVAAVHCLRYLAGQPPRRAGQPGEPVVVAPVDRGEAVDRALREQAGGLLLAVAQDVTPNRPVRSTGASRREPRSSAAVTIGGRSDNEANALTVVPNGPSSAAVTMVTGAQTAAIRSRKTCSATMSVPFGHN